MAVYEWMRGDGATLSYDTDTGQVSEEGASPRLPTVEEESLIDTFTTPPPTPLPTAAEVADSSLTAALNSLRQAVADGTITASEVGAAQQLVIPAMFMYAALSTAEVTDELMMQMDRVVARTLQALFIIGGQNAAAGVQANRAMTAMAAQITELQARVAALEAP